MPLQAVQLQPVLAPDALHGRKRDVAQFGRQFAAAPLLQCVEPSLGLCLSVLLSTRASNLATGCSGARPG